MGECQTGFFFLCSYNIRVIIGDLLSSLSCRPLTSVCCPLPPLSAPLDLCPEGVSKDRLHWAGPAGVRTDEYWEHHCLTDWGQINKSIHGEGTRGEGWEWRLMFVNVLFRLEIGMSSRLKGEHIDLDGKARFQDSVPSYPCKETVYAEI